MYQSEINSPEPEFKQMTIADVQQEYGHILDLCQNMHTFQQLLDTACPIPEDAKWIINTFLTQATSGLTSMTELINRLIKETELSSHQQPQSAQSELQHLRLELDIQREENVKLQETICHLTASEAQLKKDLMNVFQSKNRRIAELEEEVAQALRTTQPSKIVGYERNRQPMWTREPEQQPTGRHQSPTPFPKRKPEPDHRHSHKGLDENEWPTLGPFVAKPDPVKCLNKATQESSQIQEFVKQQDPVTPKNVPNMRKPIPEPIPVQLDTAQFPTRETEEIPAEDFIVISKDVERTVYGSKLVLTNILNRDYGRVVGRGGQNAERLEQEYGVKISFRDRNEDGLKLTIQEGDAESRLAASDDIINNLPVVVKCPNLKANHRAIKNAGFTCDVTISRPNLDNPSVTICGRMPNCRQAYKQLVNDGKIWYPK